MIFYKRGYYMKCVQKINVIRPLFQDIWWKAPDSRSSFLSFLLKGLSIFVYVF